MTVGLSSGTSGNRGLFLVSEREQDAWTGTVLAKLLPGGLWRKARIAFFCGRAAIYTNRSSAVGFSFNISTCWSPFMN